jgi:glycosyltransferase involved in cell wall biosynthesis
MRRTLLPSPQPVPAHAYDGLIPMGSSRSRHVLLTSHRFPPHDVGGVERYTQDLAAELARSGDRVTIVARRSKPGQKSLQLLRERLADGTLLYRLVAGTFRFEHFLQDHQRLEQSFAVAMMEASPEIVHINHLMGLSPRFIHLAHRLGVPVVVSLHDFYFVCPRVHLQKPSGDLCNGPDNGRECVKACFKQNDEAAERWELRTRYFKQALSMADRIICYSNYVDSYFRNVLDGGPPIEIIPNGVLHKASDRDEENPNGRWSGTLNVAFCGTVARHKGPHIVLEALKIASLRSVNFLLFGHCSDSKYAAELRQIAATIPGLKLRMYGAYARAELPLLLRDVDCVAVPSLVPEAGPIVPQEVLAEGIPVVASGLGALSELIRDGENGFRFDSSRPGELATILSRISDDETLRTRLRAGARQSSVITVAEHTQRVRTVYESALQEFNEIPRSQADTAEFNLLHNALVDLG